jgi:hypothetical protein
MTRFRQFLAAKKENDSAAIYFGLPRTPFTPRTRFKGNLALVPLNLNADGVNHHRCMLIIIIKRWGSKVKGGKRNYKPFR